MKTTKQLIKKHIPTKQGRRAAKNVFAKTLNDPANITCELAIMCMGQIDPEALIKRTGIYSRKDMTMNQMSSMGIQINAAMELVMATKKGSNMMSTLEEDRTLPGRNGVKSLMHEYRDEICHTAWKKKFLCHYWYADAVWQALKIQNNGDTPYLSQYMEIYRQIPDYIAWKKEILDEDIFTALTIMSE